MKAMILAAGLGTRLKPITLDIPKPLFPIMNSPILSRILQNLNAVGVHKAVINTHHLFQRIESELPILSPTSFELYISREETILGGAGGLKKAQSFFEKDTFLLVNGDIYFDFDLSEAIKFHKKTKALATLILRENEDIEKYSEIGATKDGTICKFPYGSINTKAYRTGVFCGIHIIEPDIFNFIPTKQFSCVAKDIYPAIINSGKKICAYFIDSGYWKDLGTYSEYLQIHKDILVGKTTIATPSRDSCENGIFLEKGCHIEENNSLIPPVWIGENTTVSKKAKVGPYAVLGKKNTVEEGTVISHSITWNNVTLERNANIRMSVLAHSVTIKENSSIHNNNIRENTTCST